MSAHPEPKDVLDGIRRHAAVMLMTLTGRPWRRFHFSRAFREATKKAGLQGYVFHGLRKSAAVRC